MRGPWKHGILYAWTTMRKHTFWSVRFRISRQRVVVPTGAGRFLHRTELSDVCKRGFGGGKTEKTRPGSPVERGLERRVDGGKNRLCGTCGFFVRETWKKNTVTRMTLCTSRNSAGGQKARHNGPHYHKHYLRSTAVHRVTAIGTHDRTTGDAT